MSENVQELPVTHHCSAEELREYLRGVGDQIAALADEEEPNPMAYSDEFAADITRTCFSQMALREFYEKHHAEIRAEMMMDLDETGRRELWKY